MPPAPLYEEILRQTSIQSALVAGFSFTGLTANNYDSGLSIFNAAFMISGVCTVSLEVLTLFVSGILVLTTKMDGYDFEKLRSTAGTAWYSHLAALSTFILQVAFFCLAKIPLVGLLASAIVLCVAFRGVYLLYKIAYIMRWKKGFKLEPR